MPFTKAYRPDRPTQKQMRAAFALQAPLDSSAQPPEKRKRGKLKDDDLQGIGGTDAGRDNENPPGA